MVALGVCMAFIAAIAIVGVVLRKAAHIYDFAAGLATIAILMLFLAGIQFVGMGVLGDYIGRIYDEAKRRPQFIVEEFVGFDDPPATSAGKAASPTGNHDNPV